MKEKLKKLILEGAGVFNLFRKHWFEPVELNEGEFAEKNLQGLNLFSITALKSDFSKSDLSNACFQGSVLDGSNFSGCDLTNANFKNCSLVNCNFEGSDLTNTDFTGADLSGSVLFDAVLEGMNISNANLFGVLRDDI